MKTHYEGEDFLDWVEYDGSLNPSSIADAFNDMLKIVNSLNRRIKRLESNAKSIKQIHDENENQNNSSQHQDSSGDNHTQKEVNNI